MSVPSIGGRGRRDDELLPGIRRHPAQLSLGAPLLSPLDPDRWIGKISPRPVLLMFGTHDPLVPSTSARIRCRGAAPETVVHYNGGHPFYGASAASDAHQLADFLLKYMVLPTYPPGTASLTGP